MIDRRFVEVEAEDSHLALRAALDKTGKTAVVAELIRDVPTVG